MTEIAIMGDEFDLVGNFSGANVMLCRVLGNLKPNQLYLAGVYLNVKIKAQRFSQGSCSLRLCKQQKPKKETKSHL